MTRPREGPDARSMSPSEAAAKKIADNTIEILRAERDRLFNTVEQQAAEIERLQGFETAARDLNNDLTRIAGERDDLAAQIQEMQAELVRVNQLREIEIDQVGAAIVAMAEGAKQHVLKTHTIMKNVFDEADSLAGYCEELENIVITKDAQIKDLKADLEQSERVIEAQLEVIDQQAARIKELEADNQNLVTLNKSLMNNDWILRDNNRKYRKRAQKAELLNKELKSKIGPDARPKCDHAWQAAIEERGYQTCLKCGECRNIEDIPRTAPAWQITEERREALEQASHICREVTAFDTAKVLQAMLKETDHDKP